ncbi:hypothetical protein [Streptosporangium saharense]|uniref:hypothetical protein n=1 Tax=Streptosporangium saharense TaxID=1706840 RepID=UPI003442E7CA
MIVALTVISDMSTKASRLLSRAGRVLIEQLDLVAEAGADLDPVALWTAVIAETGATRDQALAALEQVDELVPDDDGAAGSGSTNTTMRPRNPSRCRGRNADGCVSWSGKTANSGKRFSS